MEAAASDELQVQAIYHFEPLDTLQYAHDTPPRTTITVGALDCRHMRVRHELELPTNLQMLLYHTRSSITYPRGAPGTG